MATTLQTLFRPKHTGVASVCGFSTLFTFPFFYGDGDDTDDDYVIMKMSTIMMVMTMSVLRGLPCVYFGLARKVLPSHTKDKKLPQA